MSESLPSSPPVPPRHWVLLLPLHLLAVALVQSTGMALAFLMPVLARKRFGANDWQTLLITATPTIFFSLSIFWNDRYGRRKFTPYLLTFWAIGCLPLALIAWATNYWMLLVPHLITCIGGAGYHPAAGDLFKALYPDRLRGRIYGFIWGGSMVFSAIAGYTVGEWMTRDENAFRVFLPIAAGLQLLGVGVFILLSRWTGHSANRRIALGGGGWRRLWDPVLHMRDVLKADPVFTRYEAAYMTYGVGWMIAYALLPMLVTDKLSLPYDKIAESTHVAYLIAVVAMILPAGWLMDRLGAVRSTGLSFGLLTLYPLGLMVSGTAHELMITSVVYGIAHAGASVGWMLGPVALAPTPEKVPQYVAIHATMVGIRGKVFQGLGVLLYSMTHSFTVPLVLAAAAFTWSAVQMWQLHGRMRRDRPAA